jgi:type VI secretion system protein ImpC
MANAPLQFDFSFGKPRGGRRVDEEAPFRMLVLADLGGAVGLPFAQRKLQSVDIDNFDAVFARLKPRLDIALDGAALAMDFGSLDDFHPDRLFARLAPFAVLRQLRAELNDPAQFRRAAATLGASPAAATSSPPAAAGEANDIERLLGRKPAAAVAAAGAAPGVKIEDLLRAVVAPHVVADIANERAPLITAVDAAIAEQMRRVLHHPAFQSLEANWRGIERLVREIDLGETLQLLLLDATRDELAQDIQAHAADLSQSVLHRHLCGPQTEAPDGKGWSLLVSDLAFGAGRDELQLLAVLGAMAGRAGAPLLAAARPSLLGCDNVAQLADPKTWPAPATESAAFWTALRQSAVAPWIGLALPRILARQPYGKGSDPITAFAFEELAPRTHEGYLWGSPVFALALLAGRAFMEAGWNMDLTAGLDIGDLPSHSFRDAEGESQQQPCAEVAMSEPAGEAVLRLGAMAILSYRNRNAARLLRWQSIAEPPAPLQGLPG